MDFYPIKHSKRLVFMRFMGLSLVILSLICLPVHAGGVRTMRLNQTSIGRVTVSPGRSTVLSFPSKPTKVILGNQGQFGVEYIESDLAVAALSAHSQSDLFVYLDGRRFAFDLITVPSGADTIVLVRDAVETQEDATPLKSSKSKRPTRKKDFHE